MRQPWRHVEASGPEGFRSRSSTYGKMVLLTAGLLVVGLVLPYAIGDPVSIVDSGARPRARTDFVPSGTAAGDDSTIPEDLGIDQPVIGTPGSGSRSAPGSGPGGGSGTPADPSGSSPLTESDRGVSATSIRVGILIPDGGAAANLGFTAEGAAADDQEGYYDALLGELSERTVYGRTIEPVYRRYNPLEADSMRAACVYLTQDAEVFAVLNVAAFYNDPVLCVVEQNETPLIMGAGQTREFHDRSGGRLFSMQASRLKMFRATAALLDERGDLAGRTIATIEAGNRPDNVDDMTDGFVAELERRGYEVVYRGLLGDPAASQSQIPVAIQQMRQRGVDLVLHAHNPLVVTSFVQQANGQGFRPRYVATDQGINATDAAAQNMPDSYDGAIGVTAFRTNEHRQGLPEPAADAACAERYAAATGERPERGDGAYGAVLATCEVVNTFEAGAMRAGPNLTREAFSAAIGQIGPIDLPGMGRASFRPDKPDAADTVRPLVWTLDCRCWLPVGDFVQTP